MSIYLVPTRATYRIVQVADNGFAVQQLWQRMRTTGMLWWKKTYTDSEWVGVGGTPHYSGIPSPPPFPAFRTLESAEKYVADKRKYPLVVKDPA